MHSSTTLRLTEHHQVGLDEHGPFAHQTKHDDLPTAQGIVVIVDTARAMEAYATRVAGETTPPPIPSK